MATEHPPQPVGNGQQSLVPQGNDAIYQFRLEAAEKRVAQLEQDVKQLLMTTTAIHSKMPTQALVYWLFAGVMTINFLALVGHLLLRTLSP